MYEKVEALTQTVLSGEQQGEASLGDLASGMLIRHATLGLGRVVLVEPNAVHVYFPATDSRQAAKLRWPAARALVTTEGIERDPWLESLSSFDLDPVTGRYSLATNFVTHEQAIEDYLAKRPVVSSPAGRVDRVEAWHAAQAEMQAAFPPGEGEKLVQARNARELAKRFARVLKSVEGIPGTVEPDAFTEVFKGSDAFLEWAGSLFAFLSVPSPARPRFDMLFSAASMLGREPALAWPLATLFPFLAFPARQLPLWPRATTAACERLGYDLHYTPAPSYGTYVALKAFAVRLLERLVAYGGHDLADIEAFLFATASRRGGGAKPGSIAARRPPPLPKPPEPSTAVSTQPKSEAAKKPASPSSKASQKRPKSSPEKTVTEKKAGAGRKSAKGAKAEKPVRAASKKPAPRAKGR